MDEEFKSIYRLFLGDIRRLGILFLRLGSGIWLAAALSTEKFLEDTLEELEQRRTQLAQTVSPRLDNRVILWILAGTIRAVRFTTPGVKSWQHQATRIDEVLFAKIGRIIPKPVVHIGYKE